MFELVEFPEYVRNAGRIQGAALSRLALRVLAEPRGAMLDTADIALLDSFNAMHLYLLIATLHKAPDRDTSHLWEGIRCAWDVRVEGGEAMLPP